MPSPTPNDISETLHALRSRLHYVNQAWTVDDYRKLLRFYVEILPRLLDAERCGVFVANLSTREILSKAGTGISDGEITAPLEGSAVGRAISLGRCIIENDLADHPGFHHAADARTGFVTRTLACVPIRSAVDERMIGAIQVLNKRNNGKFTEEDGKILGHCASHLSIALNSILLNDEIRGLMGRLDREFAQFRAIMPDDIPYVAKSAPMRKILGQVAMVGATSANVLIRGENGTGKEAIARMIHRGGDRRDGPFVAVNCAAIPETLLESEFFGHEKGAFTGALRERKGRLEEADGGALFLDELGDMPITMQPKLLRAIQEGECARLGSNRVRKFDFRIISATNHDLRRDIANGSFREDLYYRLFAVEIVVPALRERREDIAPLALVFLEEASRRFGRHPVGFSNELLTLLESYDWPGNVRQLRHEIERLVALTPEGERAARDSCSDEILNFPRRTNADGAPASAQGQTLPEQVTALEIRLIQKALVAMGGNKLRTAKILGITRQGLDKKMRRYGISVRR
uniref:Nif-specific regulatory protein/two-component system, NtrC family, response regulator HydG n=1 Tax=Candidatus Kentrum sp. TC TaxID=2126339 RepID=A0A451AC95_9GAMM|nr:MAG: Nif-specific regulatory protein/two-component system, NtrC family, response regulator HydG [Candidatus Kentron sp. TC]VFK63641.1 MAG: Nif-specific regulatory protein/two-component system, NtrC family, response regulator HydG [Candidatus Kentron sp. TC]